MSAGLGSAWEQEDVPAAGGNAFPGPSAVACQAAFGRDEL